MRECDSGAEVEKAGTTLGDENILIANVVMRDPTTVYTLKGAT